MGALKETWITLRRAIRPDWSVCDHCGGNISQKDWSWHRKTTKEWLCQPCASRLPLDKAVLDDLVLMSQSDKGIAALEAGDETYWVVIICTMVVFLVLAILIRH